MPYSATVSASPDFYLFIYLFTYLLTYLLVMTLNEFTVLLIACTIHLMASWVHVTPPIYLTLMAWSTCSLLPYLSKWNCTEALSPNVTRPTRLTIGLFDGPSTSSISTSSATNLVTFWKFAVPTLPDASKRNTTSAPFAQATAMKCVASYRLMQY